MKDLTSSEDVGAIASGVLGKGLSLDQAFEKRFRKPLSDSINESHRMLIVASHIDASSERIIRYLSETYGVSINAATFHYHISPDGGEFLARLFLIEPKRSRSVGWKGNPNRRQNLQATEDLKALAESNGVGTLYRNLSLRSRRRGFQRRTTQSSIAFTADIDGSRKAFFSLLHLPATRKQGLPIRSTRIASRRCWA